MSLQDEIFDIEAALEDKPEQELFNGIIKHLSALEARNELLERRLSEIIRAGRTFGELLGIKR